jgi:hypothetical protein
LFFPTQAREKHRESQVCSKETVNLSSIQLKLFAEASTISWVYFTFCSETSGEYEPSANTTDAAFKGVKFAEFYTQVLKSEPAFSKMGWPR